MSDVRIIAATYQDALQHLIREHKEWLAKARGEKETQFRQALLRSQGISEVLSASQEPEEAAAPRTEVEQLLIELQTIIRISEKLTDQYIGQNNRKDTTTVISFKELAQLSFRKLKSG